MNHTASRVAARYIQSGRLSLTDPAFNLREVTKQFLMVEEHLTQPNKFCLDCIRKHLLTAEGLAEEALALDKAAVWGNTPEVLAARIRSWACLLIDGTPPRELAQAIRVTRKQLVPFIFDPREQKSE